MRGRGNESFTARLRATREQGRVAVIASLPRNDAGMARRAFEAGAVAVKVHVGVRHLASGVRFGRLAEERPAIEAVVAEARRHGGFVGIVLGPAGLPDLGPELDEAARLGVDFVDGFADELPASVLRRGGLEAMVAVRPGTSSEIIRALDAIPEVAALEAAVVPPEGYGRRLVVADVAAYRSIAALTSKPVVVPTERRIEPADVPVLAAAGVAAVMAGIVVFGEPSEEAVGRTVAAFCAAADRTVGA